MGISRQEYWSGLLFPSPGDLPDIGIEPRSPALQEVALPSELLGKALYINYNSLNLLKLNKTKKAWQVLRLQIKDEKFPKDKFPKDYQVR